MSSIRAGAYGVDMLSEHRNVYARRDTFNVTELGGNTYFDPGILSNGLDILGEFDSTLPRCFQVGFEIDE
jgi:hypothetical protein